MQLLRKAELTWRAMQIGMGYRSKYSLLTKGTMTLTCQPSWEFLYDLVVTLESAVMKFALEIDGECFGSVEAKYN